MVNLLSLRQLLFLFIFFMDHSPVAQSSVLLSHGSASYVSSDQDFQRLAVRSGSGPYQDITVYDESVPLNPISAYSGLVFYGGYQFSSSSLDGGFTREMVRNDVSPTSDQPYLQAWRSGGWQGSVLSLHGVYMFKQEDFLASGHSGCVTVDGLSVQVGGYGNDAGDNSYDLAGRFVVKVGSDLYVSQTAYDFSGPGTYSLSGASLSNELWAVYDPASDLNFDQDSADYGALNLSGVAAVGIYFEEDAWSGTSVLSTAFGFGIITFEMTGTVVAALEYASDSYVSSDSNFRRLAVRSGSGPYTDKNGFSDLTPLHPDTGYIGSAFYGGYEFASSVLDGGFNREMIRNDLAPTSDQIYLQAYRSGGWAGSTQSLHGVYLFKQEDFDVPFDEGCLVANGLSVEVTGYGNDAGDGSYDAAGRFVVKMGTAFYVSQTTYDFSSAGTHVLSGTNFANELWAYYDPGSSLDFDQSAASFQTMELEGLNAAGIYFEDDAWSGTSDYSTAFGLGMVRFEVMARPVPAWSSSLYDENWLALPNLSFESDKMIQDFSYAGYAKGEAFLPALTNAVVLCVTNSVYGADPTGVSDSTSAIQAALDDAGQISGGAVVYLPAGTYLVSPPAGEAYCLVMGKDDVVLRGAGSDNTFLLNTETNMRNKSILLIEAPSVARWTYIESPSANITTNLMGPTFTIPVESVSGFQVGDEIIVRCDPTDAWLVDHNEYDWWKDYKNDIGSFLYQRTITAIDGSANTLTIDIPTRYMLKTSYDAQVYRKTGMLREIGIEDFSIGNLEHTGTNGWTSYDFADSSTSAYEVHYSNAILMYRAKNSWFKGIRSFSASTNQTGAHLLSNGIYLRECSNISVVDCFLQKPQYGGGGGNGYMFRVHNCNECLFDTCSSAYSRHGFSILGMACSGNVFLKCSDTETGHQTGSTGDEETGGKSVDHHQWFSHSNLYDGFTVNNSWLEARDRYFTDGYDPKHNSTAAHTVMWNTEGISNSYKTPAFCVWSLQAKYGYVIGTQGAVTGVKLDGSDAARAGIMDPVDHIEGAGNGASLVPASLYEDQLSNRLNSL